MKKAFYFRGGRKSEELFVNGHYHELGVGDIISDLIDMDIERILTDSALIEDMVLSPVVSREKLYKELKMIPKYISGLKISPVLKDIFLWQPLIEVQSAASAKQSELEFSSAEQPQNQNSKLSAYHNEQWVTLWKNSAICWDVFSGLFGQEHKMSISRKEDQDVIYLCAKVYLENYREMLLAFQRLHKNLKYWLEKGTLEKEARNDLIYAGLQTNFVPLEDAAQIFPPKKGIKYIQVQTALRINDLVALEIDLMNRSDQHFRCCNLCGRYFVPFSPKSIYCHHPNPQHEGKECRKIGAILMHQDKIKNFPMYEKYSKASKTYTKWKCENRRGQPIEIEREIKSKYSAWSETARKSLVDYAEGRLSQETLEEALTLPSIQERSPLLYEAKKTHWMVK